MYDNVSDGVTITVGLGDIEESRQGVINATTRVYNRKSVLTQWLEYCATNTKVTSSNLVRVYINRALKNKGHVVNGFTFWLQIENLGFNSSVSLLSFMLKQKIKHNNKNKI